jgi:hypothetical protein
MNAPEQAVDAFYRKIAAWSLVVHVLSALTIWAFVWGTAALVLRLTTSLSNANLLWGAAGFPLVAAWSARIAKRRLPDRAAVRAYLDHFAGCGGMLMASAEQKLGDWRLPAPRALPEFHWHGRRPLALAALAVGYLALSLLLPIEPRLLSASTRLDISRETERLAQQVRVLKQEKVLDSERAETLKQKLEQVRDQAAGKDPAKALEALDHLNDVVRQAAQKAAESAAKEASSLRKLGTAAEALQQAMEGPDPAETAKLMKELAAMGKKAAEESEKLEEELDSGLAGELASGKLSAGNLAKLGAAAQRASAKLKKLTKNLHDARLIDADQLNKECEGKGKCDAKGLAEYLKNNIRKVGLAEAMEELDGNGGVSDDGPGVTPLQFGQPSSEEGAKFREEAIPPGDLAALKDSQAIGVSATKPEPDKKAPAPSAGGLQNAAAGGGSANTAVVLPQHRGAVGRYFERDKK